MIKIHNGARKRFVNFENLGSDLEDIICGVFSNTQSYFSGIQDVFDKQQSIILESAKKYLVAVDDKVNNLLNSALDNLRFGKTVDAEYEEVKEEVKTEKKDVGLENYYFSLQSFEKIMSGDFYNSHSIKDKKPRRLWRWKDRVVYIEGLLKEYNLNDKDKLGVERLRAKLTNNYYLRRKHKDIYEKLSAYFSC